MTKKPAKKTPSRKTSRGTMTNRALERAFTAEQPFLGAMRAAAIVLACANTVAGNISRTIAQLGVDCANFTSCVASSVRAAGCVPGPIPCGAATRLIDVVAVIQHAPKV